MGDRNSSRAVPLPTLAGLAASLGGVALLASPLARPSDASSALRTALLDQLALWLLFAAVLAIVVLWERRPLSSIGVRGGLLRSVGLAIALTLVVSGVVAPLAMRAVAAAGFSSLDAGVAQFGALPFALQLFAVVTAGVVEETLFRGYALERLAEATGSTAIAALGTLVWFAAVHWPVWGTGGTLVIFCTAAAFTAFYVWRRDLVANVLAHIAVDAVGLILVPLGT